MAHAKPFDLIANFARNPEPHVRRNVVAALGVVSEERSIALLTQMALADADESVRAAAEAELSRVDAADFEWLRRHLVTHVQSGDRQRALGAMALVGRLRQRGLDLRETGDSPWSALRRIFLDDRKLSTAKRVFAEQAERYARLKPTYGFRWRGWIVGLFGALLVSGVLLLYLGRAAELAAGEWQMYLASAAALATLGLVFATRRKIPMLMQWDPAAALTRDIVETTLWSIALIGLVCLPFLRDADVGWWDAIVLSVTGGLFAAVGFAAAHVGSYIASNTWTNRLVAWFWLVWIATGASVLVHTIVLWLARAAVDNRHEAWLTEGVWLYAVPASGAIALSLSRVDAAPSTEPFVVRVKSARVRAAVAVAMGAVLLVVLATTRFVSADGPRLILQSVKWGELSGKPSDDLSEPLRRPSSSYRFVNRYAHLAWFEVRSESSYPVPLTLSRLATVSANSTEECMRAPLTTPPVETGTMLLTALLIPGCYALEARHGSATVSFDAMVLNRSPYVQRESSSSDRVLIRLNQGGAQFVENPEMLTEGGVTSWVTPESRSNPVRIETKRPWNLYVDSGAVASPTPSRTSTAADGTAKLSTEDGTPLTTGSPFNLQIGAGKYLLNVSGSAWIYARFEDIRDVADGRFTSVPAVFAFTQLSQGQVRAATTQDEIDLILEVWRQSDWVAVRGSPVLSRDDPPDTIGELTPGEYVVVVSSYRDGNRARPVRLQTTHILTLDGDVGDTLQEWSARLRR